MPFMGGASGVEDHVAQLFDPMIGDGGDRLVRSRIYADDIAVAEIIVVADDRLQHFRVLAKHAGDLVDGVKLRDGNAGGNIAIGARSLLPII